MIQVCDMKKCCGCETCVQICPHACISMKEDREGFRYPVVDVEKCVECNLCEKVCPVLKADVKVGGCNSDIPIAIGGWHKDDEVRYDSSSGGAFSLFAEYILKEKGIVYGCTMSDNYVVHHIGVETQSELIKLRRSKYLQSSIGDVYKDLKENLKRNRKVLFVGTPCQCAGLISYLSETSALDEEVADNLFVCDFICHGVPSTRVFREYISWLEEKYGDKVVSYHFRSKDKGWNSIMQTGTKIALGGEKELRFAPGYKDIFINGFLGDLYLRPSCYDCKFKSLPKNYVDITIGDFWGAKQVDKGLDDGKGTSLVLLHSEKGQRLFFSVRDNFKYKQVDFTDATKRNKSLVQSTVMNEHREKFYEDLELMPFEMLKRKYMNAGRWFAHKLMNTLWNVLKLIIRRVFGFILSIVHIEWSEDKWNSFFQFVKFALVGVSNVLVSYTINMTTLFCLRNYNIPVDYIIANIVAFLLSVFWSFNWNKRYVFKAKDGGIRWYFRTLIKTYISYAVTGVVLNNILATLWIHGLGISKFISPMLNLPFSVPINFLMQKKWAYKKNK